ncbi:MAG: FHA domain-containing protein [Myxococcota bacterium]
MAAPSTRYLIVGRSRDCDVVIRDASVSARHARLRWQGTRIRVEDLGSANGTFVQGKKVSTAEIRPGEELRFGGASLSWSRPELRDFLRLGGGATILGTQLPKRRFICGACGHRGELVGNPSSGSTTCTACGAVLVLGKRPRRTTGLVSALLILGSVTALAIWALSDPTPREAIEEAVGRLGIGESTDPPGSPEEASVRTHAAPRVVEASDADNPVTRNAAVRVAAANEGPFSVEQAASIWTHVRGRWKYVNDPRGSEYFAHASESIQNEYAGDCDDFAIVLMAMLTAIGGEVRLVMMDGPAGGHAYAEVCLAETPDEVAERLSTHYRRTWDRYLGRQSIEQVHYRSSDGCPVWLNLDWNAGVPGGTYGMERWAVAIYPDGRTETLAPAAGTGGSLIPLGTGESASPPSTP